MKRAGVLVAILCALGLGDRVASQAASTPASAPTATPTAIATPPLAQAQAPAPASGSTSHAASAHSGRLIVHLILHAVGEERYELAPSADGLTLTTSMEYGDRGNTRKSSATLRMKGDYTPLGLEVTTGTSTATATVQGTSASVDDTVAKRTFETPPRYVSLFGASPFALQMTMMRYWLSHQRPAQLPMLSAGAAAAPIEIVRVGRDVITIGGRKVSLDRYTIRNLMFGQEILWMNAAGDLAAAMTFAGGLPMEVVRDEYEPALPDLYRSGVAQEMADLAAIGRGVPPERTGAFAIVGATLVDGTGAPPLKDSVVIVRQGRIDAVGPRGTVTVPRGMAVIDATGKTLLAGLWEMHTHFSGVEFGPALLAAGITTARDCGGEFDYLVAQRDAIERQGALSPRLLLAGLVDAGAEKAFGHVIAETPDAGRAVVHRYHDAGFQQIKLYTFLTPDVVRAITDEAHKLGMTVTGHVPRALPPIEGVEAGMDQINHLSYAITAMREPVSASATAPAGGQPAQPAQPAPVDVDSEAARRAVKFFKDHQTVIDPTAGWGEMATRAKGVEVSSFEPGIVHAPWVIASKFRGMGGTATPDQMRARIAQYLAVIGALHKAGVAIVPGTDTSLVGFGLHREIELYVEAGMTPLEAIQSATIVSARAMKLDREVGTVEQGKRADLILVDGDPLADIHNLRNVSRVITNGRVYDPARLWKSVGFQPASSANSTSAINSASSTNSAGAASSADRYDLAVVEQGAGRVTLLDGKTGEARGSVKIGTDPHEIAVSADGRFAYASNFGLSDKDRAVGVAGDSVSVVDLTTMTEVRRLETKPHKAPHGVKIRPGTPDHVYVNAEVGDVMLVFEGSTGKLLHQFAVPRDTHNFVFSPSGQDLYLMAAASGVLRIDPDTGTTRSRFASASAIRGLSWTSDGKQLLASGKNELLWLDPATLTVVRRIADLGVGQILYSAMTPDGKRVLAPCAFDQKVLVIDVARGATIATLSTGKDPIAVQIAPDGRHAYVSNASDEHLSLIDLDTFEVHPFGAANMPNGLTFRHRPGA